MNLMIIMMKISLTAQATHTIKEKIQGFNLKIIGEMLSMIFRIIIILIIGKIKITLIKIIKINMIRKSRN